ncbi:MAG: prepilin-type N-terminal cleavage/methylation domain-containing protein [Elusimicrobiaceae bacterium]|nr:prepilin-type N-terminal cleavage/methylation domain-containing protein [Elusimicrobiaceae bacterium]
MNKLGFTLTELLTVVLIIGVLAAVAMPQYMRSVERARATEAMSSIKSINDAIYTYYVEKESCPTFFSQLVASLPASNTRTASIDGKHFTFALGTAPNSVPGTSCPGVMATRINSGSGYSYRIWNPYTSTSADASLELQCEPVSASDTKSRTICESLGLLRTAE